MCAYRRFCGPSSIEWALPLKYIKNLTKPHLKMLKPDWDVVILENIYTSMYVYSIFMVVTLMVGDVGAAQDLLHVSPNNRYRLNDCLILSLRYLSLIVTNRKHGPMMIPSPSSLFGDVKTWYLPLIGQLSHTPGVWLAPLSPRSVGISIS